MELLKRLVLASTIVFPVARMGDVSLATDYGVVLDGPWSDPGT